MGALKLNNSSKLHKERAHSKFSASGAERWFKCPGSVPLSEGLPDKETEASLLGTKCHELLEKRLRGEPIGLDPSITPTMLSHSKTAANYIIGMKERAGDLSHLMVEERVFLNFIHPEAFGTLDAAVIGHFDRLNIIDFKYGKHLVSPVENLQLIFYALAVAHKYDFNFETVRLTIIQPRVYGYDGPSFWELGILELKDWVEKFQRAVERVEARPMQFAEGDHCFFCKAKVRCPLKQKRRQQKSVDAFLEEPIDD